ncbi:alpha/beta fold hydrolase [Pseudonocardiaceae bacterium YIM PH 21723]|nr:alpha/beta fold hydrolase [Pseudonocardiaceae bacterium YIM PH 21723]
MRCGKICTVVVESAIGRPGVIRKTAVLLTAVLVCGLGITGTAGAEQNLVRTDVVVPAAGGDLHGVITAPAGATGLPGVVLIPGSGPSTADELRAEAEAFARGGIVALTYDKRTDGYSRFRRDYRQLATDASSALRVLKARPEIDPARLGLWGFSEGGWVAPLVAADSPDVSFLITVGASGVSPPRQQAWSYVNFLRYAGIIGSMVQLMQDTGMRQVVAAGLFPEAGYDPAPVLRRVRVPVLAIWGADDQVTPVAESMDVFRTKLATGSATLRVFPDANHRLHKSRNGFTDSAEFAPGYVDAMTAWVRTLASGRPSSYADTVPEQNRRTRDLSTPDWYEGTLFQLILGAVLALTLLIYLFIPTGLKSSRVLAATGLLGMAGVPLCFYLMVVRGPTGLGPIVLSRPLLWLAAQVMAITALVCTVFLISVYGRRPPLAKTRLRPIIGTGVALIIWSAYWGLLLP